MFLADLKEREKTTFLNLAYTLIASDGILCKDEIAMMEKYKQEMNLWIPLEESHEETIQSIGVLKSASIVVQKQIIFELVALSYADKDLADAEHEFLKKIGQALDLNADFLNACKTLVAKLVDLYGKIEELTGE